MFIDLTIPAGSLHNEWVPYYAQWNEDLDAFPVAVFGRDSYCAGLKITEALLGISQDLCHNVQIGKYTSIADFVHFEVDQNHDYLHTFQGEPSFLKRDKEEYRIKRKGQILIGNDCWIGSRVTVLSGASIHNGAVIGAGAVVTGEIPPYAIAVGNPAKVIRYRFPQEIIDGLQRIQWWNWSEESLVERKEDFMIPVEEFVEKYLPETVNDKVYSTFDIDRMTEDKVPRFLFYTDFDQPYPITEHVISEFAKRYNKHDAELILYCPSDSEYYTESMERLGQIFDRFSEVDSLVNIVDSPVESDVQLISGVDAYITNRAPGCIRRCEIASRYGKRILSGVDRPVF